MIRAESPLFLLVAGDHATVTIALCEGETILLTHTEPARKTGSMLIPRIDSLLREMGKSLRECAFIAASRGPAPFTTLRVVVATVNGLGYATGLPLVGIDRFCAGMYESRTTIMLYNAFGGDLYYAVRRGNECIISGCENAIRVDELIHPYSSDAQYIGDGVSLLYPTIIPELEGPTIDEYRTAALDTWHHGASHAELSPLYLKAAWIATRSGANQSQP